MVLESFSPNPVDNDAYCYIPLLEELDFMSSKNSPMAEDLPSLPQHREAFRPVRRRIVSTQVRELRWDESLECWRISTDRGDDIQARFVVMAQGSYNRPKLPDIPGIKDFTGHVFHSARWDYDYTGGDASGAWTSWPTNALRSSVPARRVCSWFRTWAEMPSSSTCSSEPLPRWTSGANTPTDPEWAAALQPGWQEERKRNFHNWSPFVGVVFGEPDLVCDFWTELGRNMTARIAASEDPASLGIEQIMAIREEEDFKIMERAASSHRRHRR